LALRLLHLWQVREAPGDSLLLGDSQSYDLWARQIAAGDWLGEQAFYQAPLYPYFLGLLYSVFGRDLLVARLAQALLGSLSCALLASAGARFFSRPVGIAAGLVLAVYAPAIFLDGLIQKSALGFFFVCLTVWILGGLVAGARISAWLGLGLAMGGLALTRENALALAGGVLLWSWLRHRGQGRRRLVATALFLIGMASALLPVAARNWAVAGEFHLTTSQFGPNFYLGNNENANGTYVPLRRGRGGARYERRDATELAERATGRPLTPGEVSRYWRSRALAYIASRPGDWARLMGRKLVLLWNATEIGDEVDQYSAADWSRALRWTGTVCHLGVLAPLALFGIWVTRREHERLTVLYLMLAIYGSSVVIFFVFARYRYPMVAFLVPFAAAGLVRMRPFFRHRSVAEVSVGIALTLAMALFSNLQIIDRDRLRAQTQVNLGAAAREAGRLEQAIDHYRSALRLNPIDAPAHYDLGNALLQRGDLDDAIDRYRRALEIAPDYAEAHGNLGLALKRRGEMKEAIRHFRRALEIDPGYGPARVNLELTLRSLPSAERGDEIPSP
jgi:tetratricopeptide (TPR) repeat protein